MSATPRTDAKATKREIRDLNAFSTVEEVSAGFARKLETELVEARDYADKLTSEYLRESGKLQSELAQAIEQRNHEQSCVRQKQRLLNYANREASFEQQRGDRLKKELEEARELLSLLGVDIPQMAEEVRERIKKANEKLKSEEVELNASECAFCKGQSEAVRAKCTHKVFDMV